jgi:hypothetical protein
LETSRDPLPIRVPPSSPSTPTCLPRLPHSLYHPLDKALSLHSTSCTVQPCWIVQKFRLSLPTLIPELSRATLHTCPCSLEKGGKKKTYHSSLSRLLGACQDLPVREGGGPGNLSSWGDLRCPESCWREGPAASPQSLKPHFTQEQSSVRKGLLFL